jgi:hypothetical protein
MENINVNFQRPQIFINKNCLTCNKTFLISKYSKKDHLKKFCSRSCSAVFNNKKRIRSEESKNKTKQTILKRIENFGKWGSMKSPKPILEKNCIQCNQKFLPPTKNRNRKTCSSECHKKYKIEHLPKCSGGYREGSGRSKHGYYKGIYCGSTYELCWVIYNIDHNIGFIRFPSFLEKNRLKYYPDFLLDDKKTIIEIKGYENKESVERKTKLAESFGYNVKVLRKKELNNIFEYVTSKYNTKKFETLYDQYKPKYDYVCTNCNCKFSKDRKLKTINKFCSVKCSGHYNGIARQIKGCGMIREINTKRKLSKEQAMKIFQDNRSYKELSLLYKVSKGTIYQIKNKRVYKWIHL